MDKYKYYMDFDIKKKHRLDLFLLYTNKNILNNKKKKLVICHEYPIRS